LYTKKEESPVAQLDGVHTLLWLIYMHHN